MSKSIARLAFVSLVFGTQAASQALAADPLLRPDQAAFRELYEELVETNTTLSSGSCTLAGWRRA